MIDRLWSGGCRLLLVAASLCCVAGAVILGLRFPLAGVCLLLFIGWRHMHRWHGAGWTHGTARWSGLLDLARNGLLGKNGLVFGRVCVDPPSPGQALRMLFSRKVSADLACRAVLAAFLRRKWINNCLVRLEKFTHILTVAPTGRGKGVSVIIPNLLSYRRSVVVTDPKGENFRISAHHRKKKFKHRIFRLDPFAMCGPGSDTFNPLACIDQNANDFLDQCRDVANMLVVRAGTEPDPHWNDAAELIITAMIAFICACEPDLTKRNFGTFRALVSSPQRFAKAVEVMQQVQGFGGVVERLGQQLGWFRDKELGSVLTTVQRHTAFLDSPVVATSVASSSFDPRELKKRDCSLYLILPHDRLGTLAPLMRLWIGMVLRTVARGVADESRPVLFLLDEAAHLGKIQVLEDAMTLMRGMGIRLWFFVQSLAQLKDCYGEKANVFLDNFDTQQFFGTTAYESAEAISLRIGECTVTSASYSKNDGWSRQDGTIKEPGGGSRSGGSSVSYSDMARRLIKPEEILSLPEDRALLLHRNMSVIPTYLLRYFNAPEFRRGRTGKPRGLGLSAAATALIALLLSGAFVAIAMSLPAWQPDRPAAMTQTTDFGVYAPSGGE